MLLGAMSFSHTEYKYSGHSPAFASETIYIPPPKEIPAITPATTKEQSQLPFGSLDIVFPFSSL
jgi:hypothetical protein